MSVDTPAKIAILGAGPIGLEAALYARYLGYEVEVYERGRIVENLRRWGHVRLFSPFALNRSALGLSALAAQDVGWQPPEPDAILTGQELAEAYYLPLARTDLLMDCIFENTEVLSVGREGLLKGEHVGDEVRIEAPFRILLRETGAEPGTLERTATADVVIDATGTYGNHNWLGPGGIPAIGERAAGARIEYGLPDVLGRDRERYAHRHTLVIGGGYSAASSVVALEKLAREAPYTSVTWITRHDRPDGPILRLPDDRLVERDRLAQAANRLVRESGDHIAYWPATTVEAIEYRSDPCCFTVSLLGRHTGQLEAQAIIANVGYRPDTEIFRELQVHLCYASEGPMKLAAALMANKSADCLDHVAYGPESLLNPEPDFYILGAKSYGRNSQFLITAGLRQIQELFTIIGDRPDLDLYAGAEKLLA